MTCGLCDSAWTELEDGRRWNPFIQEDIGRI